MSIEQYESFRQERRIDAALQEAQREALDNPARYDFDEVSSQLRKKSSTKVDESGA